ncbi:MAG: anti-sigma factor family protein [Thermoguttaceae bacterium]
MTAPRCNQLDEYLCGWLLPDEAAHFEAHLADCAACRDECALQRRIDRLLADGNASIAPVPVSLRGRVDRGIRTARRRRMAGWAIAITAAAGAVLALGLWVRENLSFLPRERRETAQSLPATENGPVSVVPPVGSEPPANAVHVTMVDPLSAIVMPVESHRPNVTVVYVFPTIRVDREGESVRSP